MSRFLLFPLLFSFLSLTTLSAQPKIVFNTEQSKNVRVRPGDTMRFAITIGNYGDTPIDDNYRISAFFNPTQGFLSSTQYILEATEGPGLALDINEKKEFIFEYVIPEDAPEITQNLIFTAQDDRQALHIGGGYLFMRIHIESFIPLPDLIVRNYRFPRFQNIYNSIPLQFEVLNRGELLSFEATDVKVYLSASGILDQNSILMTKYEVPPLVVGDKITIEDTLNLEKVPPAVYRAILVVDEEDVVKENDEINNVFNFGFPYPINDNAFPDLFFSIVDYPRELFIGDLTANQRISTIIWNQTRVRDIQPVSISTPICNHIYLSTDNRLDENDRLLGTASLPNGISGNLTTTLTFTPNECFEDKNNSPLFPNDIEAGEYYLIFLLDAENEVVEYFETNNALVRRVLLSPMSNSFSNLNITSTFTEISLFPNPASERLSVRYKNEKEQSITSYALYNLQGALLLSGTWESVEGDNLQELDISGVGEGTYILKIEDEVKKVVVAI
ncbi:MAG: CARDB domain-containing protein [Bacteroidota bacterium]